MNPDTTSINQFLSSIDEDYKNYKEEIAKKIKESEVQSMNVMDPMKRIPTQPNQFVSSMMRDLELFKGSNFYETSQKKIETQRNQKIRIQEKQNELIASRNNIFKALPFKGTPNIICSFRPEMSNTMLSDKDEDLSEKYERYCKERESNTGNSSL